MRSTYFPTDDATRRWLLLNLAGGALGVAGVAVSGGLDEGGRALLLPGLLTGLLWGLLQWWGLRASSLRPGPGWVAATALGWLLSLSFLGGATMLVGAPPAALAAAASDYGRATSGALAVTMGYFLHLTFLAFFGILGGLALAAPQAAWLFLRRETRPEAQRWLGSAVWGWSMGMVVGGVASSGLALLSLPLGLTLLLTGGLAGAGYGLFTLSDRLGREAPAPSAGDGRGIP